jgi:DNA modification methylase
LDTTQRDVNDSEESIYGKIVRPDSKERQSCPNYDPPLPTTVLREDCESLYGKETGKVFIYDEKGKLRNSEPRYDPPLPTTVLRETDDDECYHGDITYNYADRDGPIYDPPLPHSILEIKSEKRKHPTQKPVALIEWCLKYYSKEGNTVLDPTAGSGSTAIACINMDRKYICIEKDPKIFKVMEDRIKERLA